SLGNVSEKFAVPLIPSQTGPASMILNTSVKYWPAEYHSQSAIEAALFLRQQIDNMSQIASVVIESHDAAVDIIGSEPEKWKPETRETADHSLPYITAIALIDGEVTEAQLDRKSTRLNSSHRTIAYAVFCLKSHTTEPKYTLSLHDALPISTANR